MSRGFPSTTASRCSSADAQEWRELSATRLRWLKDQGRRKSPAEIEIQSRLSQKVNVSFTDHPLADVLAVLGKAAQVNIFLDPQGMIAEGVSSDTPVTINLTQEISLNSALNLILEPLNLGYVIQNEVLRSPARRRRNRTSTPRSTTWRTCDPDSELHSQLQHRSARRDP